MKTSTITCFGVLLFCFGCSSSAPVAEVKNRSLADLVDVAMAEVEEIKFCLSEDAGTDSLKQSADRLLKVVEALPESVSNSELAEAKKDELSKSIGALKEAYDSLASTIDGQASSAEISKANSKVLREIKLLSKLSR